MFIQFGEKFVTKMSVVLVFYETTMILFIILSIMLFLLFWHAKGADSIYSKLHGHT